MSRADRFTFLSPLIVLSIVAVFAVFVVSIMYQPGLASILMVRSFCWTVGKIEDRLTP